MLKHTESLPEIEKKSQIRNKSFGIHLVYFDSGFEYPYFVNSLFENQNENQNPVLL
jgi:hypothetical protein